MLGLGIVIGAIGGTVLTYVLTRKTEADSARMVSQQAEEILRMAETKLSGKKEVIDGTLNSMKDEMKDGLKRVEQIIRSVGEGNVKIDTRLGDAAKIIKELSDTTGNLKNALSSNSGRGQWGERMAEDVLRLSGLIEGVNFIKQKTLNASGSKPDFTFMLPKNLKLNMDVKFPFNNYQLYAEAQGDKDRDEYKKKFLKDVRLRLKEVQTRDYINPEENTVDYVLLFVPNEQIFTFINEMDRDLIDEAMRGRTILCSPLSLYAILAVIRQSIDSFSLESKSQEMLTVLGSFKQQWEKFKDQMGKVHDQFETVHKGYEELTGTRERMLDKQLTKLDEMRIEQGIGEGTSAIEQSFEKAAKKQIAAAVRDVR
jgi:DNA recombination protein RmuC